MIIFDYHPSPLGEMLLLADHDALLGVYFVGQQYCPELQADWHQDKQAQIINDARQQIEEFFSGRRQTFSLQLKPNGTAFQQRVWQALGTIPFGITVSYAAVAAKLGLEKRFSRAVGSAIGHNPIMLLTPCHRVVASNGQLTGYAGGLDRKQALLALEKLHGTQQ